MKRDIPSLDGIRAISVTFVILGHSQSRFLDSIPFSGAFRNGHLGVTVFFVISGFLITHLLLKELNRTQTINLRRFYFRRTFRISPPFYAFLLVAGLLAANHRLVISRLAFLASATYTWNYAFIPGPWILGHSWSLALEEQFYLIWPLTMVAFSKRVNLWIAIAVIALSPLSRVVTYLAWPTSRTHIDIMLHTRLDTIMVGCLLALLIDQKQERFFGWTMNPMAPILCGLFLFTVDYWASLRWRGMYALTVGFTLENVAVAATILFAVFRHESLFGKMLNLGMLKHIGRISYSLYLWQQLFSGPYTHWFPLNVVAIVACAEVSYYLVERPSAKGRDWLQSRLQGTVVRE